MQTKGTQKMATSTLEERVTLLERELAEIRSQRDLRAAPNVVGHTAPDFAERFFGIFADDEMADRVWERVMGEREKEREEAQRAVDEEA